jgi:pimeloyl-ACP methyl ester carboxylesterase
LKLADLGGARIAYRDSGGGGAAVVFMHPASCDSRVWESQAPAIAAAGLRFIAWDRRGYRRSDAQPGIAADDLEALRAHLGIERFHLVGTAAGGIAATDYALSFPQRLRTLVIANSIVGVQDDDYLELSRRLRPSPQFEALPAEFRELGPAYRATNREGVRRWMALVQPRPPDSKMRNRITFALLETIRLPTLLLTGDADLYTPPPVLKLFKDRIKNSKSIVIPGCGHSAYWEQPELFNRAVLDFIGKR